jgi:hypothetical protein
MNLDIRTHQAYNERIHDNLQSKIIAAIISGDSHPWETFVDAVSGQGIRLDTGYPGVLPTDNFIVPAQTTEGAGSKLMFNYNQSAVRGGLTTGTAWDLANLGVASVAFGQDNVASGDGSFVGSGQDNVASGDGSVVVSGGNAGAFPSGPNSATGVRTFVGAGSNNTNSGDEAFIGSGQSNVNAGGQAFLGAGTSNNISIAAPASFIGGGLSNMLPILHV